MIVDVHSYHIGQEIPSITEPQCSEPHSYNSTTVPILSILMLLCLLSSAHFVQG